MTFLYILALLWSYLILTQAAESPRKLFVFGDSYSDVNNRYTLTLGLNPASPCWRGRHSNGPVWNEYTAKILNLYLSNHAVSGATVNNTLVKSVEGIDEQHQLPSLKDQIDAFMAINGIWRDSEYIGESYAAIQIGSTDIVRMVEMGADQSLLVDVFAESINTALYDQLDRLRDFGFKRFLVFTPISLDVVPGTDAEKRALYRKVIDTFNTHNFKMLRQLRKVAGVEWANSFNLDKFIQVASLEKVASEMGITNTTGVAWTEFKQGLPVDSSVPHTHPGIEKLFRQGDGVLVDNQFDYFYFDGMHITAKPHRILGHVIAEAIKAGDLDEGYVVTEDLLLRIIKEYNLGEKIIFPDVE